MKAQDNRRHNTTEHLQPYQWKKGQSGNPKGRKAGKSMKDFARDMLSKLTDDERMEFLKGIPKDVIWRLAEGNPAQDSETKIKVEVPIPILDVVEMKAIEGVVSHHDKLGVSSDSDDDTPPTPSFNKESERKGTSL